MKVLIKAEKDKWITEKIKKLIKEGKSQKQATAIAFSMWEDKNKVTKSNSDILIGKTILLKAKKLDFNNLEQMKKYFIDLLEKLNRDSFEKSFLLKGKGYSVGTIREWQGKKYKKVSKDKWMRFYEGENRGQRQAINNVKKEISKANTLKELADILRKNKNRFKDDKGNINKKVLNTINLYSKTSKLQLDNYKRDYKKLNKQAKAKKYRDEEDKRSKKLSSDNGMKNLAKEYLDNPEIKEDVERIRNYLKEKGEIIEGKHIDFEGGPFRDLHIFVEHKKIGPILDALEKIGEIEYKYDYKESKWVVNKQQQKVQEKAKKGIDLKKEIIQVVKNIKKLNDDRSKNEDKMGDITEKYYPHDKSIKDSFNRHMSHYEQVRWAKHDADFLAEKKNYGLPDRKVLDDELEKLSKQKRISKKNKERLEYLKNFDYDKELQARKKIVNKNKMHEKALEPYLKKRDDIDKKIEGLENKANKLFHKVKNEDDKKELEKMKNAIIYGYKL